MNSESNSSEMIVDNIKHEPPEDYLLILPPPSLPVSESKVKDEALARESKGKSLKCEKCDHVARSKANLKNHSKICGKKKLKVKEHLKFQCDLCPQFHSVKGRLRKHMVTHQELRPHVSLECGEGFKEAPGLKRHISRMREYSCVPCNFECKCQFTLLKHYKTHQKFIKFECDQCAWVGKTKATLMMHKKKHDKKLSCECCGEKFSFPCILKEHQELKRHGAYKNLAIASYACDKCDKSFVTLKNLKRHKIQIHYNVEIKCKICSKVFKNKDYLITHVSIHDKLPCKICNRLFSKHVMSLHLREHRESQEYHCDLCGGQYKQRNAIKTHMVDIHKNGEYVCILCRERFNSVHKLFDHKKFHIGRKQYKCLKCSAILQSNFCLKRHNKKKH
jgi:KRAB domain-containing zinc finger protein